MRAAPQSLRAGLARSVGRGAQGLNANGKAAAGRVASQPPQPERAPKAAASPVRRSGRARLAVATPPEQVWRVGDGPRLPALVGVLGDVHAEDRRLQRALRFFRAQRCDEVWCAGDVIDGFGDDARCVRLLRDAGADTVRGNHERWLLEALPALRERGSSRLDEASAAWLSERPTTRTRATPAGELLLCHGVGEDDMTLLLPRHGPADLATHGPLRAVRSSSAALMVCGHTHVRMVRRLDDLVVLNAGTLYRKDRPGCLLLDLVAREARFFDVHDEREPTLASRHPF